MVEKFRCPACETVGKWKNVDEYRLKPEGMHICESCGFVSYPSKYKTEEEIKEYYRKEYRSAPPQITNIYTGERKLHYHNMFLTPLFEEWEKAGITKPVIGEVGSAIGMFLNWVRGRFPEADIHGTELTIDMRKVAKHEYNLDLKEDFDFSKKYDLIASYHVLEHQIDPDIMLKKYADCLKDTGIFYLSCPVWFRDCDNSSHSGFSIEEYWAPDHINSWGENHLEWIIARAGLEPIMKNTHVYGFTYLLRKTSKPLPEMPKWDVAKNIDFMDRAFKCWKAIDINDTALAIEVMPNCTTAWIHHYEYNRAMFDKDEKAREEFFEKALAACPDSANMIVFIADIRARYEQYDKAIELFYKSLVYKPNAPNCIMGIANAYRILAKKEKDPQRKIEFIKKAIHANDFVRKTSVEFRDKALSWQFHDMTMLPL